MFIGVTKEKIVMGKRKTIVGVLLLLTLTVAGFSCSRVDEPKEKAPEEKAAPAEVESQKAAAKTGEGQVRHTEVYFGDTHLHTSFSPDAYLMGNRSTSPDTAYRYAKGLPVVHPFHRAKIQIGTPLDFLVVAEHGEYMGIIPMVFTGDPRVADSEIAKRWKGWSDAGEPQKAFAEGIGQINAGKADPDLNSEEIRRTVWQEVIKAAEQHNDPGKFTAFIGWEWTSTPEGANLHRVVFQREGGKTAGKYLPYTSFDSFKPEDLWRWLDVTSKATGANFVAIPHNQNISKGLMFPLADSEGKPIGKAYAESRMRWETIVETTQIKGDSETHPILSPTDEFADFETYDHAIEAGERKEVQLFGDSFLGELTDKDRDYIEKHAKRVATAGDYSRSALKRGLAIEARIGINPYKFGLIGSTDSHSGMASYEENNFWGKMALDSIPEHTFDPTKVVVPPKSYGIDMGAAGLAAVWAEENTREALFDAFKRKETYATSGPRLRVRFFGGWDFHGEEANSTKLAEIGYKKGVPMGSELSKTPKGKAPSFLIMAIKDPKHANLDRVQVIKGWVEKEDGMPHEKIYDVALSDGRKVGTDGKVKPVGNTVDLKTATWTDTIGDAQLATVWTDPDFDPALSAFYYVRVLQIPTPRHSLYDAVALNRPHPEEYPATIQERAYTSPIWYAPGK
jgi:hypothetical protein